MSKKIILFFVFSFVFTNIFAQNSDTILINIDNQHFKYQKFSPLIAFSEVVVINAGVHIFDRFALKKHWAQVSFGDIGNNFKKGFVWDNDKLSTNLFWHPYHGGLYFNSARANNLNFWQSIPYTFVGSFIWEFMGEKISPRSMILLLLRLAEWRWAK